MAWVRKTVIARVGDKSVTLATLEGIGEEEGEEEVTGVSEQGMNEKVVGRSVY